MGNREFHAAADCRAVGRTAVNGDSLRIERPDSLRLTHQTGDGTWLRPRNPQAVRRLEIRHHGRTRSYPQQIRRQKSLP